MKITYESPWAVGDRVEVDGDKEITGLVTGVWVKSDGVIEINVSRFHAGTLHENWFAPWRLRDVGDIARPWPPIDRHGLVRKGI